MNIKLLGWIGIAFVVVIVGSLVWYLFRAQSAPTETATQTPPVTLPVGGSAPLTGGGDGAEPAQATLALTGRNGTALVVLDFIHNGVTIPDGSNKDHYLLAGNLGYCVSNPQQCQAAPAQNFTVYYDSKNQTFLISLTAEPIGEARAAAERFMVSALGISGGQLCSLTYYVGTTRYVNEQYAGKNLGFSFCNGATPLPQ